MIQLPPGFDWSTLLDDYTALALPVVICAALITAYCIYKKVVTRL